MIINLRNLDIQINSHLNTEIMTYSELIKYPSMTKILGFISLLWLSSSLYSQKTERYDGDFYSGGKIKGSATYAFYKSNNQTIKHGSFRFSAREKTDDWRFSHSISGNYKNGLKDGNWTYNYISKDFESDKTGFFFSYEIILEANYKDGMPDGQWKYKGIIEKYKKIDQQNRTKKESPITVEKIFIEATWNKGILVDSLIFLDSIGNYFVRVQLSENGILNGLFEIQKAGKSQSEVWENGILKLINTTTEPKEEEQFTFYKKLKNPSLSISLIENTKLNSNNNELKKLLIKYLFNDKYFLYRYVEGDQIIIKQQEFGNYEVDIKGLIYYDLTPIMTPEEQSLIKNIEEKDEQLKQMERLNAKKLASEPTNQALKNKKDQLKTSIVKVNFIRCQISAYQRQLTLLGTQNQIKKDCNQMVEIKNYKTKLDFLRQLNTQVDNIHKLMSALP